MPSQQAIDEFNKASARLQAISKDYIDDEKKEADAKKELEDAKKALSRARREFQDDLKREDERFINGAKDSKDISYDGQVHAEKVAKLISTLNEADHKVNAAQQRYDKIAEDRKKDLIEAQKALAELGLATAKLGVP